MRHPTRKRRRVVLVRKPSTKGQGLDAAMHETMKIIADRLLKIALIMEEQNTRDRNAAIARGEIKL